MNLSGGITLLVLVALGLILLFIVFFSKYKASARYAPIEKGKQILYSEDCTGYMDDAREPFIRLRIYDGFLVISSTDLLVLRADDVDTVQVGWRFPNKNVRIDYHTFRTAHSVSLLSMNCENLKEMIQTHLHLLHKVSN